MVMTIEKAMEYIRNKDISYTEIVRYLDFLNHYFEYEYGKEESQKEAIRIVDELVRLSANEEDADIRCYLLDTLMEIAGYVSVSNKINLTPILEDVSKFNLEDLSVIIDILGDSGNESYRSLIESFKGIPELDDDVNDALVELDYRNR
ncbi:MAG: hypothetical protein LBI13_05545 [Streptococcaceae bacterium]|jgi:hypothetical protein|nr:hypothetical protein [Streptococcaceae bacterium]